MSFKTSSLGDAIKSARLLKNLSQVRLSQLLGVEQPYLSGWERGTRMPNEKNLEQLSGILGVNFASLDKESYIIRRAYSNEDLMEKIESLENKIDKLLSESKK